MTRSALLLFLAILSVATPAFAKDGDDGGGSNSGSGGGDDDNGGDSNGADSADDDDDDDDDAEDADNADDSGSDSDRARAGVSSGAILPLAAILSGIENHFGARMINAELHRKRGRLIYELELITPAGRVMGVSVDAATARVIKVDD
jgi:uncharacterized membrane protein YkoI